MLFAHSVPAGELAGGMQFEGSYQGMPSGMPYMSAPKTFLEARAGTAAKAVSSRERPPASLKRCPDTNLFAGRITTVSIVSSQRQARGFIALS
jgi:hypothetical protein